MGRMGVSEPILHDVRSQLAQAGDPQRAQAQQAYMRSSMPFRGVPVPQARRLSRAVCARHLLADQASWEATIRALWDDAAYREERYAALALARYPRYRSWLTPEVLPLCRHLVVTGAWWDLVDEASHLVGAVHRRDPAATATTLRRWARDEDMWLRRVAVISQLDSGQDTDRDLLSDVLTANLADREFFIRKACGWALRQYARTDPQWVRAFAASHEMSGLTRREATKHLSA
jgi:3-methyladenine DNA glycosylase AlkD